MEVSLSQRQKSLQELENDDWGKPTGKSSLVSDCRRLRCVPLEELTPGNCRLLLGQNIGAPFLVPLALEWLSENPLLDAQYFPGDLLKNVLTLKSEFWIQHTELWWEVREVLHEVESLRDGLQLVNDAETVFKNAQPLP